MGLICLSEPRVTRGTRSRVFRRDRRHQAPSSLIPHARESKYVDTSVVSLA